MGNGEAGYRGACMHKNYNWVRLLVFKNTRDMLIANYMDKVGGNSFCFGFQFPNGPVCVSRVCVCVCVRQPVAKAFKFCGQTLRIQFN